MDPDLKTAIINQPQAVLPSNPSVAPNQPLPAKKKHKYLRALLIVLLCEVLIGAGVTAFFWRDSMAMAQEAEYQSQITDLEAQLQEAQATLEQYESEFGSE